MHFFFSGFACHSSNFQLIENSAGVPGVDRSALFIKNNQE
jgi:hypothetical protein